MQEFEVDEWNLEYKGDKLMGIKKVYYGGKCIMTVDMDYVKEDSMYEYLNEILRMLQERAYKEFDVEKRM